MTCAAELHPERARKYNYCLAPECQEKNARGLTMVAIGMNKAAEELRILDDTTLNELASGKFRDQRRVTSGPADSPAAAHAAAEGPAAAHAAAEGPAATTARPAQATGQSHDVAWRERQPHPAPTRQASTWQAPTRRAPNPSPRPVRPARQPWTPSQQRLALLYNSQGLRPAEIAGKLGISSHLVTQIILSAKNRGKS